MPINTATITPASLKAKEVATEDYVDSAVSSVPNTDEEWQARVQYALDADETVINGSKITTGSIDAGRVNTGTLNANVIKGHIGNVYINITNPNVYKVYLCTSGAGVIGYNIDRKLLSIVEDNLYTWSTADYVSKESDIDSAGYQIIPSSFNVPSDYSWAIMSAVSTKNRYYTIINSQAFSAFSTIIANHIRKIKTIG